MAGATTSLRKVKKFRGEQNGLESPAKDSDSLVCQVSEPLSIVKSSRTEHVKLCLKPEGPPSKAKYVL